MNTNTQGSTFNASDVLPDLSARDMHTLAKEADMALAVLASINQILTTRREGSSEMKERIGVVQCAALKFHFSMIPAEYGEHQALFDAALAHFMKVGTDG